jgi:cyclopropane-fatty-acyl-phospholipid synthase
MFEAVGLDYYDAFFSTCDRLLTPDGSMVMQAITMNEHRFDAYRKQSDWIQRRIFPGAQLASIREILNSLVRSTRLSLYNVEDIGLHYAYTLAEWRRRFHESIERSSRPGLRRTHSAGCGTTIWPTAKARSANATSATSS